MNRLAMAAATAFGLATSAQAAVFTLDGVSAQGANDFRWTYQGTLGPDEGLRAGDRFVIFDFGGYIDGSIFAQDARFSTLAEGSSAGVILAPGQIDNPALTNLVFTYTGPNFRDGGGPLPPLDISGFGARSIFSNIIDGRFFTTTTKNNRDGEPGGTGTPVYTLGSVGTPIAVPEPATWAMMLGGFALAAQAMRRRRRMTSVVA